MGRYYFLKKGKLGQTQVSFDNLNPNACYSIQLQNACFTNTTSKEICDINFQLNPTAEGNELNWTKPAPESIKNISLIKNNNLIPVNSTSYIDKEIVCKEENCYQLQFTSNGSNFISERLCVKNNVVSCETGENPIHIPTAFSPNGDGINDKLFLYGDLEKFISLKIYNRRGYMVKLINYPYEAWSGDEQSVGLYEYLLKFKNIANKEVAIQGTIMLIK